MKIVFLLITLLAATQAREDLVQQLTARATNHLSARTAAAEVLEDNIRPRHDGNHIPAGLPDDIAEEINEIGQLLANNDKEKDGSGDDEANFLPDKPEKPAKPAKKQGKGSKKAGKGSKKTSDEAASDRFIADRAPPQQKGEPERATGELGPADLEAIPASLRRYIQALEDREQVRKREEKEKAAATAEIRSLLLGLTRKRQQ
ncbi:PREDICTED: uncharacterized protein LOC109476359 [Branchiostoma belcheri]|uniref:Uncharacterized protein LOC109476359 n=1 Tax=Branchiostoma belcheri TaxID=7741 RepID=A0A6P4ZTD2_BRABE|nr:PREDICTED: uncharacterized protein LOC109476359 [Branchiostoma belcheri]XP_019632852.1 PREDICTED: uncharacterized protein LOC109476359 [Branchiostoma belcheri]